MHAPPDFRISVRRFGVWRVASALVAAVSTAVACAWLLLAFESEPWMVATLAFNGLVLVAVMGRPIAPIRLNWDGQVWHLGPDRGQASTNGGLRVMLDLGNWMLLRFLPASGRRTVWVPVQRLGHETEWAGLRHTVFGARPMATRIAP